MISAILILFQLFEGTKVYRGVDGKLRWFRPNLNMIRMNRSAEMIGLPMFSGPELVKCLMRLIQIDQEWVPHSEQASLYIRPSLIGVDVSTFKFQAFTIYYIQAR
ncbi:hypothetical protein JTB14_003303 [Gonioctena quinquepunctata]|nr:hypothetical protein JTB14_003303 [Gonioctena quinquepunctata]